MSIRPENPPIDTAFELAANPLNSLNPPPRDLPDLLDKLLEAYSTLENRVERCNRLEGTLNDRLEDLQNRLKNLRQKFPQWRSDRPQKSQGPKDKHRLAFEQQETVYARMVSQVYFMHTVANIRLPLRLAGQQGACKDVFNALLGDHHNHQGIEIANSAHLHCVDGCRWYFEYGPYEWSKKPFSNEWWAEMNHTDWDWVKMRKHIDDLNESIFGNHIRAADDFEDHLQRFVPSWFWKGASQRWGLQTRIRVSEDQRGAKKVQMIAFVAYEKSQHEMQQEHLRKVADLIKKKEQDGMEDVDTVDVKGIVIEPMGAFNIDNNAVFDGKMSVKDWEKAVFVSGGSWLKHWGYVDRTPGSTSHASAPKN